MSRFGILIVAIAVAALTPQTTRAQEPHADAKRIQTAPPIPWFDPSLANSADGAKMLAISVATAHNCSAGSSAICYGLCAPSPVQPNRDQSVGRKAAPIKQLDAIKSEPTLPVLNY